MLLRKDVGCNRFIVQVHDYLAHLVSEGQFSQFELAVTRVPIDRLDIHQVVTTCRQNQLYDGIAYVMNNALHDFVGPLQVGT